MKFEINADGFKKRTTSVLKVATKLKADIVIQATPTNLFLFAFSDTIKVVVKFTDDDLRKLNYKCHASGTMTARALHIVPFIPLFREKDSQIIISCDENIGSISFSERNCNYPFELVSSTYHWQQELQYTMFTVNRKNLQEGIRRLLPIKPEIPFKATCDEMVKPVSHIQIECENNKLVLINSHTSGLACYIINNIGLNTSHETVSVDYKIFAAMSQIFTSVPDNEISIGVGDSKLYIYTHNIQYEFNVYINRRRRIDFDPSDYYYQLSSSLKDWSFIGTSDYSNDNDTKIEINYFDGNVKYSFGEELEENYYFPIEYEHNMKYYSDELLKNVPTHFTCSTNYIAKMVKLSKQGERLTMYFGGKKPGRFKRKTVLVEYPVKDKSNCQLYYIFVAQKEGA